MRQGAASALRRLATFLGGDPALGPEELVILGSPEPGRFSSWFSSFSWLEMIPFSSSAHLRIPKGPWWEYPSLVTLAG